jgi:transcriptional regulator with XRE-family HTH domain
MAYAEYSNQGAKAKELRKKAGRYIRSLREAAGLTQNDLSKALGLDYYTFISQVETGMTRVPPDKYRLWATALKVEVEEFTRTLLSFYDPFTYDALFTKKKEKRDVE